MAKLEIKDLEESVELDRKAMTKIIGGQGRRRRRTTGLGITTGKATGRSATGAFCGKHTLFKTR